MLGQLTTYSKTNVSVSLVWIMSCKSTILACFKPFRREARKIKQNVDSIIDHESTTLKISSAIYFFKHFKSSILVFQCWQKKKNLLWNNIENYKKLHYLLNGESLHLHNLFFLQARAVAKKCVSIYPINFIKALTALWKRLPLGSLSSLLQS